jgi:hypothetical protein|tara:strand:+ start:461 stop:712 length:252 start_codon:yes stop_codon:yes gene_type:complete
MLINTESKPDMIVGWEQHLKNGNVWKANIELSMQGGENDEQLFYNVDVYVVAPNIDLAQYIVTTMYPDYESICVNDNPVGVAP